MAETYPECSVMVTNPSEVETIRIYDDCLRKTNRNISESRALLDETLNDMKWSVFEYCMKEYAPSMMEYLSNIGIIHDPKKYSLYHYFTEHERDGGNELYANLTIQLDIVVKYVSSPLEMETPEIKSIIGVIKTKNYHEMPHLEFTVDPVSKTFNWISDEMDIITICSYCATLPEPSL